MHRIKPVLRARRKGLRAACLLALSLAFFTACASARKEEAVEPSRDLTPEAAARLEETARTSSDAAVRAETHLHLARWHTSHANPRRNYPQALKELELYVSLTRDDEVSGAIRDWLAALQEIDRLTRDMDQLTEDTNRELKKSRQRSNKLSSENKELKEALEKLKALDLKMEEKRRQVK